MKPNSSKEVKEAILKEVKKIAEAEYKKSGIFFIAKDWWIGGFVSGYLFRVTELMKQNIKK